VTANSLNRRRPRGHEQQWNDTASATPFSETMVNQFVLRLGTRLQRRHAGFDLAHHVFDHDDGVVDHEAVATVNAMRERLSRPKPHTT